jgi:hypothetical protein
MSEGEFILESRFCDFCDGQAAYIADNNASGQASLYCESCEEYRADKYGCALLVDEGCGCEPGGADCACGCGGTGRL